MNKRIEIKCAVSKLVEEVKVMKKINQSKNREKKMCILYIKWGTNTKYKII